MLFIFTPALLLNVYHLRGTLGRQEIIDYVTRDWIDNGGLVKGCEGVIQWYDMTAIINRAVSQQRINYMLDIMHD